MTFGQLRIELEQSGNQEAAAAIKLRIQVNILLGLANRMGFYPSSLRHMGAVAVCELAKRQLGKHFLPGLLAPVLEEPEFDA